MEFKFLPLVWASLSTVLVGWIWYHPKVFGSIWMKESGVKMGEGSKNMAVMVGGSVVYAFLISTVIMGLSIHQMGAFGMIGGGSGDVNNPAYKAFMAEFGTAFRTFKHGALHGAIAGLFFALLVIGTGALYEGRSFKYTLVTGGFWVVACSIMGAIICGLSL